MTKNLGWIFPAIAVILGSGISSCGDEIESDSCATFSEGCACGDGGVCDNGLVCLQGSCSAPADSESYDSEGGETCSYQCVAAGSCSGTRYPEMTCASAAQVCCDSGPDGDADTDTDADTDADTDTDTKSNVEFVGNITTAGKVRTDFLQYWDQITPENEGKWASVEGFRDNMNWSNLQPIYDFAVQNNIPFKQHTFVWGSQYPNWIDGLSASEQAAEIEEWISAFCQKYPKTALIDVVNEALPDHRPANFARNAFGNDWIIRSFELAHQYCPNARLMLNDYNVLRWNTEAFISLAKPVIASGYMDAVGCQAHGLGGGDMGIQPISELKANIALIAALGVDIYITEYDIEQTNDQTQLQVMQEQFPVFYETPEIKGITYWGYLVGSTWRNGTGLLNTNNTPRPALTWLMDYLER